MYDDLDITYENYSRAISCLERYVAELAMHFELSDEQKLNEDVIGGELINKNAKEKNINVKK